MANGQIDSLSNSAGVTIFALTDSTFSSVGSRLTKAALDQQIISGFLGYTPDFVEGKPYTTASGGKILITTQSGVYYANGVRIVRPNIITKNGVVHYVADVSLLSHFSLSFCSGGPKKE